MPRKVSLHDFQIKRDKGQRITMLTAYDYPAAKLVDEAGVDAVLVGDTLAMTVLGHRDTVSVTVDEMLHHCKAVARGASRALLVGDMPFMSYQVSRRESVRNAGRYMKEAHMDAVKLEGGKEVAETVRAIVSAGVPVMGHVGLTPQTATQLGGYKVQATSAEAALKLRDDALALQDAGCFAVVLEAVPAAVAQAVTDRLTVPTIGIGAGAGCAGQVLVFHDALGLFDEFVPKFVKQFAQMREPMLEALKSYRREVEAGEFPGQAHSYGIDDSELQRFLQADQS